MIIRKVTSVDVPSVAALFKDLMYFLQKETGDYYFNFRELTGQELIESISNTVNDTDKRIIVAEEKSKIIGFIIGEITNCYVHLSKVEKIGYIAAAYVSDEYRDKGLMKALVKEIEDFFREQGINCIELHVLSENKKARIAWEKLGFHTFREQRRKIL